MGTCTCKASAAEEVSLPASPMKPRYLQLFPVGKGAFGQVWKVEKEKNRQIYALKKISKRKVIEKKNISVILNEWRLLGTLRHPLIVNLKECFQDRNSLYFVLDYLPGADLRFHFARKKTFSETETRFLIACLVSGLEYLHINNVVHRDIKPENLVFTPSGYLKITDFGVSRRITGKELLNDASGTPGYMAPETICRLPHGKPVDFFAVGVIAYECMTGKRPYRGKTRNEIKEAMLTQQIQLKKKDIPTGWSLESADFINKCIQRKPELRLGFNGPHELKNHTWLRGFLWKKLLEETLIPPFKPGEIREFQERVGNFNEREEEKPVNTEENKIFARFGEKEIG